MRERKLSFIVFGSCILVALVVLGAYERTVGRAEMKRWQDQWYAAHPIISQQGLEFPTTTGRWIPFSITFDTFGPGMEGKAWMTKDGSMLYIQGSPPAPAPKPSKGSKPLEPKYEIVGDVLEESCEHSPTADICQYKIVCMDRATGKLVEDQGCSVPIKVPTQPNREQELLPCYESTTSKGNCASSGAAEFTKP